MRKLPVIAESAIAEVRALQISNHHTFQHDWVQNSKPTCKKGCSHCCYHPFLITIAEGILLYRWLHDNGKWTAALRKRLEESRNKVLGLSFEVWLLSDVACPLLERDTCVGYAARPLRCRMLLSVGAPSLCRPAELGVATPLLPSADSLIRFTRNSRAALKRCGVKEGHLMPLAEALFLGELVDTGRLSLQEADVQHVRDLING